MAVARSENAQLCLARGTRCASVPLDVRLTCCGVVTTVLECNEQAGRAAGMLTVSVPTALAGRFKPPSAQLSFDGFGPGGGVTWARISQHLRTNQSL